MAGAPTVSKAELTIEGGEKIKCLFNPKDFTVTKANSWKSEPKKGATAATPEFTGGQPREIALTLLFDSTLLKPEKTVKVITDTLMKSMDATQSGGGGGGKTSSKRPPTITFEYGGFSFKGVAKSLSVQFMLFMPTGEPIRAEVKISLMQYDVAPTKGQNPTTRADSALGSHLVRDGDSLASIAYSVYGDATRWRPIAEANGIVDPLRLRSGRFLSIPEYDG